MLLFGFSGSQPLLPSVQQEDSQTEKRIAHILQEAQHAMQHKKVMEQVWNKEVRFILFTYECCCGLFLKADDKIKFPKISKNV